MRKRLNKREFNNWAAFNRKGPSRINYSQIYSDNLIFYTKTVDFCANFRGFSACEANILKVWKESAKTFRCKKKKMAQFAVGKN